MHLFKSHCLVAIGVIVACTAAPAFAARPAAFTIEEVMQAPYPSSMIASSKGNLEEQNIKT